MCYDKAQEAEELFTNVDRACVGCAERDKLCIIVRSFDSKEVVILLPLIDTDRDSLSSFDPGYYSITYQLALLVLIITASGPTSNVGSLARTRNVASPHSPLTPHSSPLFPISSLLTSFFSLLCPLLYLFTPHFSRLIPSFSLLTDHLSPPVDQAMSLKRPIAPQNAQRACHEIYSPLIEHSSPMMHG